MIVIWIESPCIEQSARWHERRGNSTNRVPLLLDYIFAESEHYIIYFYVELSAELVYSYVSYI